MITRYGLERYVCDTGATVIHEDQYGVLYRRNHHNDEPVVAVRVKKQAVEPDGTQRECFLRVSVAPDLQSLGRSDSRRKNMN